MDPDANLQEQERILDQSTAIFGRENLRTLPPDVMPRMRELQAALRAWLQAGGFAPDWSKAPRAAKYYGQRVNVRCECCGGSHLSDRSCECFDNGAS